MKKTILLAFLVMLLHSCEIEQISNQRKCFVTVRHGSGWSAGGSTVECDSFQMQGTKKAFVWVDGHKINLEAEDVIYPHVR